MTHDNTFYDFINESDYDNISSMIKVLETSFFNKIRLKNEIISKLLEENKILKDQIEKLSNKKKLEPKPKKEKCIKDFSGISETNVDINIFPKPKQSSQLREANDFFKKEYQNYLDKHTKHFK